MCQVSSIRFRSLHGDALDVTLVAPYWAPGVLDLPVRLRGAIGVLHRIDQNESICTPGDWRSCLGTFTRDCFVLWTAGWLHRLQFHIGITATAKQSFWHQLCQKVFQLSQFCQMWCRNCTAGHLGMAVADDQHAMVQCGATGGVEDAAAVELEGALVSLDGHAHWLVCDRLAAQLTCKNEVQKRGKLQCSAIPRFCASSMEKRGKLQCSAIPRFCASSMEKRGKS